MPESPDMAARCLDSRPETRPTSKERLVAEIKGIRANFAGLEIKWIEADTSHSRQDDPSESINEPLSPLATLRRALLLQQQGSSFMFRIHSKNSALRRLAPGYYNKFSNIATKHIISSLCQRTGTSIESLFHFLEVSLPFLRLVYTAEGLVDSAEGELLKCLGEAEFIFNQLFQRFRREFDHQPLIYVLIFFRLLFEFPNGIRHLCTTMPWTIWPALVVLWGVCWMFYPSIGEDEAAVIERIPSYSTEEHGANSQGLHPQLRFSHIARS